MLAPLSAPSFHKYGIPLWKNRILAFLRRHGKGGFVRIRLWKGAIRVEDFPSLVEVKGSNVCVTDEEITENRWHQYMESRFLPTILHG